MAITLHSFYHREDFDRVREFLMETYNLTRTYLNWIPSMFENMWRGPCGTEYEDDEDEQVKIWTDHEKQTSDSKIVAVTICKPSGECRIFIHPEYRHVERKLVLWLEEQIQEIQKNRDKKLLVFSVNEWDHHRQELLRKLGYTDRGPMEHERIRPVDLPIPKVELPENYTIRDVDIETDFEEYRSVIGSVFNHCMNMTPHLAKVYSEAEFYNKELDIVIVAPNGTFAAFTTVRIDPVSRFAELEPVGVHPNHRQKGLAKAICCEGLRRLQKYKPQSVTIIGAANTQAATNLYDSLGFSRSNIHYWEKIL
ncbi:GNAT family N-acetyltransferase [Candidatus Thorarchaeota archaeon]|nr:MAG: GNAT family N-acetyltransferase [Candidatus Thorarchaeota archaeon]